MGFAFVLRVPDEDQTEDTVERFYRYHLENSRRDITLDEYSEYDLVRGRLRADGRFYISKKPTNTVIEAGEPPLFELQREYEHVVRDQEGFDAFVEWLEAARTNLEHELDEERMRIKHLTIDYCVNMIEFARRNGYAVGLSY